MDTKLYYCIQIPTLAMKKHNSLMKTQAKTLLYKPDHIKLVKNQILNRQTRYSQQSYLQTFYTIPDASQNYKTEMDITTVHAYHKQRSANKVRVRYSQYSSEKATKA